MNKAEKTRQFIIEKAAPVFNTKGYSGTSLSDMTEATGLTKGSIYGNFADKDEVALACFDYNTKCTQEVLTRHMARYTSYRDKLLVYPDVYSNSSKYGMPMGGCPVLNTTVDADDTHPALRAKAGEALIRWKDRLITLIEGGKTAGEFKPAVDAERTALTIIALLEGMIVIGRGTGKPAYAKAVIGSVEELIKAL
jgi:TetR/AcrR family transcriptional repressor of nem operon